jgi:putative tryptophan/tyrosine transport system substrate-binding protein
LDRRKLLGVVVAGIATACLPAPTKAQRRLWRIGYHSAGSAQSNAGWLDAFRQGMADLGWSEARHYVIDARYADGVSAAVPRLAKELVATQPDVLLTTAEASIQALGESTQTIPIVFTIAGDPVGQGYARTLQRPGGNLTGLTVLSPDLAAKRIELLKETHPALAHLVVLFQGNDGASVAQLKGYAEAAARLTIRVSHVDLRQPADIEPALGRLSELGAGGCAIASSFMINIHSRRIAEGILRARLPSIGPAATFAEAGLLIAYSTSIPQNFRRAAGYVDRILKGAKPGDLAIEQPTKFDLVINGKTARALGVNIPQSIMLRADRVIE